MKSLNKGLRNIRLFNYAAVSIQIQLPRIHTLESSKAWGGKTSFPFGPLQAFMTVLYATPEHLRSPHK